MPGRMIKNRRKATGDETPRAPVKLRREKPEPPIRALGARTPIREFDKVVRGSAQFRVETAAFVLDLLGNGITLGGSIARFNGVAAQLGRPELKLSETTFRRWLNAKDDDGKLLNLMSDGVALKDHYQLSREGWAERRVERAVEISGDTSRDPRCRQVEVQAHLQAAAMFAPHRFGKDPDKQADERSAVNINIHPAAEASVRARATGPKEVTVDVHDG